MKIDIKKDLWQYLKDENRPILLYGMGNGADKIIKVLEKIGLEVSDFFASDGFVRGHCFKGKTVLSFSDAMKKYEGKNPIVLLSFATSLDDVIDGIIEKSKLCEIYAPDVPVFGDTLFDMNFFNENKEKFDEVYSLLADEESKKIYENVIKYKLTGKLGYLFESESSKEKTYADLLKSSEITSFFDNGAYNGDSIRELLPFAKNLKTVYAVEPDKRNFKKLEEYCKTEDSIDFKLYNCGVYSADTELYFDKSGNRNANFSSENADKAELVNVRTVDSILGEKPADYIKYDVEGLEKEALIGSMNTIKTYSPKLLVSLYHRSEDMFLLPLLIHEANKDYKLYLRRFRYIPAWDLNLYAKV